jgi:hypothetical protein
MIGLVAPLAVSSGESCRRRYFPREAASGVSYLPQLDAISRIFLMMA